MKKCAYKILLIISLCTLWTNASAHRYRPVEVGPSGFTYCAREHHYCHFYGVRDVAYGAGGHYVYRTLQNGAACKNRVFGDPFVGVRKFCYVRQ